MAACDASTHSGSCPPLHAVDRPIGGQTDQRIVTVVLRCAIDALPHQHRREAGESPLQVFDQRAGLARALHQGQLALRHDGVAPEN
jgi:hypothetical protein